MPCTDDAYPVSCKFCILAVIMQNQMVQSISTCQVDPVHRAGENASILDSMAVVPSPSLGLKFIRGENDQNYT